MHCRGIYEQLTEIKAEKRRSLPDFAIHAHVWVSRPAKPYEISVMMEVLVPLTVYVAEQDPTLSWTLVFWGLISTSFFFQMRCCCCGWCFAMNSVYTNFRVLIYQTLFILDICDFFNFYVYALVIDYSSYLPIRLERETSTFYISFHYRRRTWVSISVQKVMFNKKKVSDNTFRPIHI